MPSSKFTTLTPRHLNFLFEFIFYNIYYCRYHQVKFIERQKVTRLEKSIKRQLQQLLVEQQHQNQQQNHDSENIKLSSSTATSSTEEQEQTLKQISNLQQQLQSIAMDQLYIAFFPTNMKYMALFTNGMNRVVDDERGQKRRKAAWNVIREGLMAELAEMQEERQEQVQQQQMQKIKYNGVKKSSDSDGDSSSVPSDDSDSEFESDRGKKASTNPEKSTKDTNKNLSLKNAKTWVNLDEAKRALISMPANTYPNDPSSLTSKSIIVSSAASVLAQPLENENEAKRSFTSNEHSSNNGKKATKASDSRFELSKGLDGLFHESTTGDDYREQLPYKPNLSCGVSSDENASGASENESEDGSLSDDDDDEDSADPLKESGRVGTRSSSATQPSSSSSSSSSTSSSSSESDSNSDSDSDAESTPVQKMNAAIKVHDNVQKIDKEDNDDSGDDDFFTNDKVSTEDIFNQIQNEKKTNRGSERGRHYDNGDGLNRIKKPDKSKGFKSQNQSKREYRSFQHRQKRQKFG